jgi:hypothetical protein
MFGVAYGLRFGSNNDPTLIRMEKLVDAVTRAGLPTQFLVVSILFRDTHDESFEFHEFTRMCFQL